MHAKLRPYDYHGVTFRPVNEGDLEARGECPFCSHPGQKFYVKLETGRFICSHCSVSGNIYTFLTLYHKTHLEKTTDADWKDLADHRRGVPWQLLRDHGFALLRDRTAPLWLIPVYSIKNALVGLRTYILGKYIATTAGLNNHLWRLQHYNGNGPIYLCEGEWDALALEHLRRSAKKPGTVLSVPGASQFKHDWVSLFQNRDVVLCFDNDTPGENGAERTATILHSVASSIRILRWPPDTSAKWDIRDTVNQELFENAHDPTRVWRDFERMLQIPMHLLGGPDVLPLSPSENDGELPKCTSFRTLLSHFRKHYHVDAHMADGLAIIMATVIAIQRPGDPLWLFIVAPPGSGKTMFLTSLMKTRWTIFKSSLTPKSLISGFRCEDGDPSLIPQLTGKVLVLKDYTEITTMCRDAQEEIYGVLRGAYDGHCEKTFGNGLTRTYPNCHFGMIAGVTDIIYGDDRASLGERFVKYQLVSSMEVDVTKHILAAISGMATQVEAEHHLQRMAAGFLNRDLTTETIPDLDPSYIHRVVSLAQIISHLRATIPRTGRNDELAYRPSPEVGTRLAKQLVKLGQCLAIVFGKPSVDKDCWKLIHRVALDTAKGWSLDVFLVLAHSYPRPLLREQIAAKANISGTTAARRLENLRLIGTIKHESISTDHPGQPPFGWTLHPDIATLWSIVEGKTIHPAATTPSPPVPRAKKTTKKTTKKKRGKK